MDHTKLNISSNTYISDFPQRIYKPLFKDKEFLRKKYVDEGLSLAQISSQICSSKEAVRTNLEGFGIPLRHPHAPHGRPSQPKYGQRLIKGRVGPHIGERRVMRAIKDLRKQGLSLRQIASYLNEVAVPTKRGGSRWQPEMVNRILSQITRQQEASGAIETPLPRDVMDHPSKIMQEVFGT